MIHEVNSKSALYVCKQNLSRSDDSLDLATYPADQYPAQWLFVACLISSFGQSLKKLYSYIRIPK